MTHRIAIVLAGCGNRDGSEIHESVLTIRALSQAGAEPLFFAPDILQNRVVDFLTGEIMPEQRNVLREAARIARGKISDISKLTVESADAVIFPGGQGAALNLCDFLLRKSSYSVHPQVERVVREFHAAGKPQGFICIAPVIAAKVLGSYGVELTVGEDESDGADLEACGARHFRTPVTEIHIDQKNRVVSTPAYMTGKNITDIEPGICKLVKQVIKMI